MNDDRLVRFSVAVVINAQIALAKAEMLGDQTQIELLHKDLQNKLRYKTTFERSFQRSLRNIEQFGQRRVREAQAAERLVVLENKAACQVAARTSEKRPRLQNSSPLVNDPSPPQTETEDTPPTEPRA